MWEDNLMAFTSGELILIKLIRRRWGGGDMQQHLETTSVYLVEGNPMCYRIERQQKIS
jgi:hypothetical protein